MNHRTLTRRHFFSRASTGLGIAALAGLAGLALNAGVIEQFRAGGEIEGMLASFVTLKGELQGLRTRLAPLDDQQTGVKTVVGELNGIREQLNATIERLDRDGDSNLADRASRFAETKQALDQRVSHLLEQFSRLDGINKDIRGLFAKLRGEVDAQLVAYDLGPK